GAGLRSVNLYVIHFFDFIRSRSRHTGSKRDWSSDVCSSDLPRVLLPAFLDAQSDHADPIVIAREEWPSNASWIFPVAPCRFLPRSEEPRVGRGGVGQGGLEGGEGETYRDELVQRTWWTGGHS